MTSYFNTSLTKSTSYPSCIIYPDALRSTVESIHSYPPTHNLLEAVMSKVTPLSVVIGRTSFLASWTPETKTITLDEKLSTPDQKITFLLFELLNALSEEDFERLRQADMNKNSYVEGIEQLEHNNLLKLDELLNAAMMADRLITKKVVRVIKDFPTFYKDQQLLGHAQKIAERYNQLHPEKHELYEGSWKALPSDPQLLSILHQILTLKNLISKSENIDEKKRYTSILEQSLANIEQALSSDTTEDVKKFFMALSDILIEENP